MASETLFRGGKPGSQAESLNSLFRLLKAAQSSPEGTPAPAPAALRTLLERTAKLALQDTDRGRAVRANIRAIVANFQELAALLKPDAE